MIERAHELKRRRQRTQKVRKLKLKLNLSKDSRDKEVIIKKIQVLSPWWTPPEEDK